MFVLCVFFSLYLNFSFIFSSLEDSRVVLLEVERFLLVFFLFVLI